MTEAAAAAAEMAVEVAASLSGSRLLCGSYGPAATHGLADLLIQDGFGVVMGLLNGIQHIV